MVPILGDRVRAALRIRGLTVSALAHSARERQQTVDLMVRGVTRKCRRARLEKVARALRVPAGWLAGKEQLKWANRPPLTWAPQLHSRDLEKPALIQLVEEEFFAAFYQALGRDVGNHTAPRRPQERLTAAVRGEELINPFRWIYHLLRVPPGSTVLPDGLDYQDIERACEALGTAFGIILKPWFQGRVPLDYKELRRMSRWGIVPLPPSAASRKQKQRY